jgi:hypothetical protein
MLTINYFTISRLDFFRAKTLYPFLKFSVLARQLENFGVYSFDYV